jgi:hypothetical protein
LYVLYHVNQYLSSKFVVAVAVAVAVVIVLTGRWDRIF